MAGQYYLMAQLPSFSVNDSCEELPITEEYFYELCGRFLDSKSLKTLKSLSLNPPKKAAASGSVFLDSFYDNERKLRFALAQIRALRLNKKFEADCGGIPSDIIQTARTAMGMESPLEAERFLNQYRCSLLESNRPQDEFSVDSVFCYGLKLKLALRMKKFNAEKGMASYHNIYESILNKDKIC